MALVLHLGGAGECGRLILEWSVQAQESGDLHTVRQKVQENNPKVGL